MPYKYCVVWFAKEKSYIMGSIQHIYPECKMFRSLKKAKEFKKGWTRDRDATIYALLDWSG